MDRTKLIHHPVSRFHYNIITVSGKRKDGFEAIAPSFCSVGTGMKCTLKNEPGDVGGQMLPIVEIPDRYYADISILR